MADRIVYKYPEMANTVQKIKGFATQYQQAGDTLINSLTTATEDWEGDSKTKFMNLVNGSVSKYVKESVPKMVEGLADLLESDAKSMQETDTQIASNIPDSI